MTRTVKSGWRRLLPAFAAILVLLGGAPQKGHAAASVTAPVPGDFGHLLADGDACDVWWCVSTYKVTRDREAPEKRGEAVRLEAARGEYEAAQVVVRPSRELTGLTARLTDLRGPNGAAIPAGDADLLRVAYVKVHTPTDDQGSRGWWPDPLPPLKAPMDLEAGRNQPLWVRLHVPRTAPAGDYRGTLNLRADGWQCAVPVRLHVFDFALPRKLHMSTAFGISSGRIRQYHHLETDEQMRRVWDLYMRDYREHGINPYRPALSGIRHSLKGMAWRGGRACTDDPAEGAVCVKVADNSAERNVATELIERVTVRRDRDYVFRFRARTAKDGHEFMVTVSPHDASGEWMYGRNIDVTRTGTEQWSPYRIDLPAGRLPEGCRSVRLSLRATRWTGDGELTGTTFYDDVFFGRAAGGAENLLSDGGFEAGDARIELDFAEFDREMEKYVDGMGFQTFRLGFPYMPRKGRRGQVGIYPQGSLQYERIMGGYLGRLEEHLRRRGWLDEAFAYWIDEPRPEHYDDVRYGMNLLGEHAPGIRRMLTEQPEPELYDSVDIWCPVLHMFDPAAARDRLEHGDEMWWYVCTGPKHPYAGLFIDHCAVDLRIWQWMAWKWDVHGCLIWQTNWWTSRAEFPDSLQDPWKDPMSYRSRGGGWWGNGDGRFVYPPPVDPNSDHEPVVTGPIDSIRWEMLREGLEDYEYFYLLKQALKDAPDEEARKLLTVPDRLVRNAKEFTRDPRPLYERRRRLADAMERLTAH